MANANQALSGLPWNAEQGENQRFYVALAMVFIFFLPPALLIPSMDLPEPDRREVEKVPPQLARLIEQKKPPEPVIPIKPEPKPEPEPEKETAKPEKKQPPEVAEVPKPTAKPKQTVEQAREKASRSGLMAMKDTLASMRSMESVATPTLQANVDTSSVATSQSASSQAKAETLSGSGGVKREQGPTREVAVANHEVRNVEVAAEPTVAKAATAEPSSSGAGTRAMSNIRRIFDANKTALDSLYRRELRQDPTLQGRITLKLVIEPDGSVSKCEVVESELQHSKLEQRIAMRVRLFNFGSADVEQRELTFPLDFLPG